MSLLYSEELAFGGMLKIENDSWHIQYYFSGPDVRYSGVHLRIEGVEVNDYIKAWYENYDEYQKLKIVYKGRRYEKNARKGMSIKIGEFFEGVCLVNNHLPINTNRKLKRMIDSLVYAKEKADEIIK